MRFGAFADEGEIQLLPFGSFIRFLIQMAMMFDAFDFFEAYLVAAFAQSGIDFFSCLFDDKLLIEFGLGAIDHLPKNRKGGCLYIAQISYDKKF